MTNTFSQIYIHLVFSVRNKESSISDRWKNELYKYITAIVKNSGQNLIAINGTSNHVHILMRMRPTCCLSDLVRDIKKSTNSFIREQKFTRCNFYWQEGFGAFSCSSSSVDNVIRYIQNQEEHHKKRSFKEEYLDFLKKYEVEYDPKYLPDWLNEE